MTPAIRDLYQSVILEHHAHPRNRGPLPDRTHEAGAVNALCGDRVTLRLRLEGERIAAARFEGEGCALSRASASLLTLAVTGRTPAEAEAVAAEMTRLVSRGADHASADRALLGELVVLEGVREVPARVRCVTLPWEALGAALSGAAG